MKKIKAATFGYMSKPSELNDKKARESLSLCIDRLGINTIVLPIVANQKTTHSTHIDYHTDVPSDSEIESTIHYAHSLGLDVILKPMVNCLDGTWRAYINFFDIDVKGEPKWSEWFLSYEKFIVHYAQIAEKTKCTMLVIGCELVSADSRELEWRNLISTIRQHYKGLLTYNCDKYQENHLKWWDALDVISSSGYYPYNNWDEELVRINQVIKKYRKPFFFCEVGAPSITGGELRPNDWQLKGQADQEAQLKYYKSMFESCKKRNFIDGFAIWDWKSQLYPPESADLDTDYAVFDKKAETVIKNYYKNN